MKLLLGLVASLFAFSAFGQAGPLTKVGKTMRVLGVTAEEQGSLVVATTPEQVAELAQTFGLAPAKQAMVVVTGAAERTLEGIMVAHHKAVTAVGTGDQRALVFVDDGAFCILKVIEAVLGDAVAAAQGGVIVIKGGLDDIAGCLEGVLAGTIDLGIDLAVLSAQVVCCTLDVLAELADFVFENAGCIVIKSVEGVILVAGYAAEGIVDVVECVGQDVYAVAKGAVSTAFQIIGGILRGIGNALGHLCGIFHGGCHVGRYYVQT